MRAPSQPSQRTLGMEVGEEGKFLSGNMGFLGLWDCLWFCMSEGVTCFIFQQMSPEADYLIPDIPAFRHLSPSIKHTRKRGGEVCLPYKGLGYHMSHCFPLGSWHWNWGGAGSLVNLPGQPSGSWVIPPISKSYFVTGDAVSIIMAFVASLILMLCFCIFLKRKSFWK